MEKGSSSEQQQQGLLLAELARIQQLGKQMEAELSQHSAARSCKPLLRGMLSSVRNSILIAKASNEPDDSPPDAGSETCKFAFRDQMSKKRKTLPKWTSEVRVGSAGGGAGLADGTAEDGYNWRKYGQKDILGAKYPRGYYRCTHRMTRSCPATKQVQRSDEDPLLFHVTYHGNHTCFQRQQRQKETKYEQEEEEEEKQELLLNLQAGLRVDTEGLEFDSREQSPVSFSFGSKVEAIFSSPSTPDNCFSSRPSPSFLSPTTSNSTYFSLSPHDFEGEIKLWSPESGATNSAADSSLAGMDFMLQELEFEPDFSSFFS
ncbi:hypothetical protein Cni_G10207 [Canna indica]|uniref:WRKY domain-containing protein n=1 Tax=Canna indica TaxID=4628 RepID=A0AAQ3Q745_9LILI|nr:hypothetical protein Cni_G10207 [Canna indica]